ncbi:hypothetical protein TNCV_101961 [Trichonephila clavipes]|nr:hypothetical protein TNCV_101961 [Trichonephila clavipes]
MLSNYNDVCGGDIRAIFLLSASSDAVPHSSARGRVCIHQGHLITLSPKGLFNIFVAAVALVVKAMHSWEACLEFEPCTTEDLLCRGADAR